MDPMTTHWLTAEQVAQTLGFTSKTIRSWCVQGRFPNAKKFPDDKPRSEWRIPESDVRLLSDRPPHQRGRILTRKERAALMNLYRG
ncbi:helix-turn-helix domain-containing protein [Nesterenkonia sp. CF4.4]|uniref:helix-turn-helix domain-containing protein n=1 Tax=Nesterenkonia sp. CF4.4 TaxID=3373079 RepID=UPI003EE4E78A